MTEGVDDRARVAKIKEQHYAVHRVFDPKKDREHVCNWCERPWPCEVPWLVDALEKSWDTAESLRSENERLRQEVPTTTVEGRAMRGDDVRHSAQHWTRPGFRHARKLAMDAADELDRLAVGWDEAEDVIERLLNDIALTAPAWDDDLTPETAIEYVTAQAALVKYQSGCLDRLAVDWNRALAERDAARAAAEEQAALVARLRADLDLITETLDKYDAPTDIVCSGDIGQFPTGLNLAGRIAYLVEGPPPDREARCHDRPAADLSAALGGGSLAATPNEDAP